MSDEPVVSLEELQRVLDGKRQESIKLLEEMQRDYQRRPDPGSVFFTRLNTLISMLLAPQDQLAFEIQAEEAMAQQLRLALAELRQHKLTAGISVKGPGGPSGLGGGLIVPGRG